MKLNGKVPKIINSSKSKKALFLDRDGVLNKLYNNRPPWKISEIEIFSEAKEIIKIAKSKEFLPVIVSNQPDAARGHVSIHKIYKINQNICNQLNINNSYLCIHAYDNLCECRKPKPGMFFQAASEINIDLNKSYMVGDRLKDIVAGKKAGCKTIYLNDKRLHISDFNVNSHRSLINIIQLLLEN